MVLEVGEGGEGVDVSDVLRDGAGDSVLVSLDGGAGRLRVGVLEELGGEELVDSNGGSINSRNKV